ncbi:hypothetical protein SEVIR_5G425100v4 [Setaria viridis]|uniref:TF-B3 domain-containing protein n=1 Tax=Setaria viridis TaxID=4556 RepID=A0A4U6URM7_SETVI|nr:B3 domain-containing protein Os01g0905400-like isoform X3 [Setaria viridis]TKW18342.1 hypothetical protein SEVIR_5G425100v2 [Setaria viridis]
MVELIGGGALKKEPEEAVVEIDSEEEEAGKVVKRRRRRKKKACDPHQKRACVDCTKRCARIHGRAASSSPSPSSSKARPLPAVPSFFKVMMGYFSDDMDIPPPFARTILDLAGSNIYLEDAFGFRWRVRLCFSDGVLSFGHGWKNFVLDHAVSCGEFLVFRQIARSVFTVQMFAPSAVERLFLCERNKRQSRKRKPRQKASSPSIQAVKTSKNGVENRKKKQRTDHHSDLGPKDCQMPDHVCLDDSDVPNSASEPKCSETSGGVPEVGVAEPQEDSEAPTRHECEGQEVLDGEAEIADDCTIFEEKESECNARVTEHLVSDATEIEHGEGLNLPTNADVIGPLAMMDLNEENIDDIFLSADIYEFGTDVCNPEAFSVDLNMEGPITTAQTSGFSCLEDASQNHHSSMGVGQSYVMPAETLSCSENKEMTDALETGSGYACVAVHDIDINELPATEPSPFAENSSPPADIEVHSGEFALSGCNQGEQNEVKKDKQQDGQGDRQASTGQNTAEVISSGIMLHEHPHLSQNLHQTEDKSEGLQSEIFESGGVLALAAACSKFCIAVPAPGQTWLELPNRLPVIPRTKKQGRKVVILKDPCMRLWPVLYQCTPRFSGFITGWVDICRENNLQEGDTCEFELSGNSELSFQVVLRSLQ